ncbi:MAG: FlgO family outer membrane protein [Giesbergeria sp.]|uniref:FlgO family outer membrane protein n=1 Tax=Giesbergeria sp. TaxID=2818473 RepID=UPI0026027CC3|nr:FlgO family outer membrane protein [Giesbergeria sp.]MDD2608685.1 FlgO family outer membrane protein [Giesbergeria sp.]
MKRRTATLALLAAALALPGCARYYYGDAAHVRADLVESNAQAIDILLKNTALDPARPLLVATLVSVDRLGESSRLGRTLSEQLAGQLVQRGVLVVEPRLRDNLVMLPSQGELLLSRELHEVSQRHDAQAVLIGTYAVSQRAVYVSLKLVHPVGNLVVAAADYTLPMDDNVRALLYAR